MYFPCYFCRHLGLFFVVAIYTISSSLIRTFHLLLFYSFLVFFFHFLIWSFYFVCFPIKNQDLSTHEMEMLNRGIFITASIRKFLKLILDLFRVVTFFFSQKESWICISLIPNLFFLYARNNYSISQSKLLAYLSIKHVSDIYINHSPITFYFCKQRTVVHVFYRQLGKWPLKKCKAILSDRPKF